MFRFPEEVEATAVSYLKRFYLKNTVMDWHPKNVMYEAQVYILLPNLNIPSFRLTALFLATKTTNNPISLETYTSHIPKTAPSDVLDLEFLVAQSLNFEFTVWHAHRALWGIWLDLQVGISVSSCYEVNTTQSLPDVPANVSPSTYDTALNYIRASRLTDAELLYAPSQIALAAFSLASPELALKWAQSKLSSDATPSQLSFDAISPVLVLIKAMILNEGHAPDVEAVREVDRRLRICKNPEKVEGTKAYLAKQAEEERKAEEKRNKKVLEMQKGQTDPFGDEIQAKNLVDYDDDDDE